MSEALEKAKKKVIFYEKKLAQSKQLVIDTTKRLFIRCKACDGKIRIGETISYEALWYTAPYGCTEGDHWNSSDERWVKCPHKTCLKVNRFFDKNKDAEQLKLLQFPYVYQHIRLHGDKKLHETLDFQRWVQ